eukprot:c20189_g1_i1.p1 GENE.c20189_g1_i1~~c20189_g1_i1.p1  ORF type:complete len:576 (+),score=278.70 c20189_g1_i1:43-1770(+)
MRRLFGIVLLSSFFLLTQIVDSTTQTDEVDVIPIPYGDNEWFSLSVPNGDPRISTFFAVDFDFSEFLPTSAPYGRPDPQSRWECPLNRASSIDPESRGIWTSQNLLLIRQFDLPAGVSGLEIKMAAYKSVAVYLNGQAITGGGPNPIVIAPGICASPENFIFSIPDRFVLTGPNVISIQVVGDGQLDYFDIQVKAFYSRPTGPVGNVYTWGKGVYGILGNGYETNSFVPGRIVDLKELRSDPLKQLSLGVLHSVLLTNRGRVYVWGNGGKGQLGMPEDYSEVPLIVPGLTSLGPMSAVAAGSLHTLAVDVKGRVYCFGDNKRYQCGISQKNLTAISTPTNITGLRNQVVVLIGAKDGHSAAITADDKLFVWGRGIDSTPKYVGSVANAKSMAVGSHHVLILDESGNVFSYGLNSHGQLGLGNNILNVSTPTLIKSLKGHFIVDVQAGSDNSFAITDSGSVFSWGGGAFGKIGLGIWGDQPFPTQVISLDNEVIRRVGAGMTSTYFLTERGEVYYSGANLRDGSHSLLPIFWASGSDKYFTNVYASHLHFAAITYPSRWNWTKVGNYYEGTMIVGY